MKLGKYQNQSENATTNHLDLVVLANVNGGSD